MKAVVFGGSGFLGSHVADALTEAGHKVTIFDIRPSPYIQASQKMIVGNILDEAQVGRALKGQDVVYNLAGFADIEAAKDRPIETIKANILGNGILLEEARKNKIKRYVFASTVYVYSSSGSFYRASKQACESYIESYREMYGLPYTILRFGSLYGQRSDERNSIYRMVTDALATKKMVYPGNGEELREYIHVKDAAASSVDILDKEHENQCIILTGHQPLKVKDLLTMVNEILGGKIKIVLDPNARPKAKSVHYSVTPYSFTPKEGKKFTKTHFTDMGQGLLGVVEEIYNKSKK